MSEPTVYDFLVNPNLLSEGAPLTDEQLDIIGDLAVNAEPDMPLADLVERVRSL